MKEKTSDMLQKKKQNSNKEKFKEQIDIAQ